MPAQMEAYQKRLMKRPARRQAEMDDASKVNSRPEGAEEYNIWYHKWCGTSNNTRDREPAATRCSMEKVPGYLFLFYFFAYFAYYANMI